MFYEARVTPCVGVWIETIVDVILRMKAVHVTPCVGVWIETIPVLMIKLIRPGHTLRGCVD